MSEVKIGQIEILQIHGDEVSRRDRFDPAPLIQVDEASVDVNGMLGWTGSAWVVDNHHTSWPEPGPRRPLSVGFTSHYEKMRERYWDIPPGAAGENVVISCDRVVLFDDLGEKIIIRGDDREVELLPLKVAKPCLQFSSYMRQLPELGGYEDLRDDLAFLDDGIRGFIVTVDAAVPPTRLRVGDEVFLA